MRFATNTGKTFYSFSRKRMLTCPLLFLLRIETELDRRDASQSLLRSMKQPTEPEHRTLEAKLHSTCRADAPLDRCHGNGAKVPGAFAICTLHERSSGISSGKLRVF